MTLPLNQTVIQGFVKVDSQRQLHVTLSIGAKVELPPDILHSGHLQGGHQVETSLNGFTARELAALGVGHLRPATI